MIGIMPMLVPSGLRGRRTVGRKQIPFLASPATFRAFVGGRGSGKTYAGTYAALAEAGRRRCIGAIVAPTYTMVTDDVLPVFEELAGLLLAHLNRSDMAADLINGSRILFRSASNVEHIQRLRGLSTSWVWMDEAAHVADGDQAWKILIATLREHGRMGRAWLSTTPRGKGWIHDRFVVAQNPDYELFTSHTQDNEFTAADYKKALKEAYGIGWFAKQELAGEFCDPEGSLFHREWFKVVDQAPEFAVMYRGWDLACTTKTTSDYTVGVLIGITAEQDVYILDVVRGRWEWPAAERVIIQTALLDGPQAQVCIESVAFQLAAIQKLHEVRELGNHVISEVKVERDKLSHALPVASKAQAGKVYLLRGAWNSAYLDEVCTFCGDGKGHDDQVDGTTVAYRGATAPIFSFRTFDD